MLNVSAKLYCAALPFAGERDVRAYLNGVYVEPAPNGSGVVLVAINGHVLACLHDPEGICEAPAIIPRIRAPREGRMTCDGSVATFDDGSTVPAKFVQGRYPDWQAVLPNDPGTAHLSWIFPEYVAQFARLAKALRVGKALYGMNIVGQRDSGALVTFVGIDAFGVIMGQRRDDPTGKLPAWMRK